MILVMTASVQPANIEQLCLTDAEVRLKQYCAAIQFYIMCKKFDKIVFCDNSAYCCGYETEQKLAKEKGVELEILRFQSDLDKVEKYGKGYGEGEILKYVFENSKLLENEIYFYKVTGRLIIRNIARLVNKNNEIALFNRNLYAYKSLDTRFWGMRKNDYEHCLMESHTRVNDKKGKYLEMCYKRDIERAGITYRSFCRYPVIDGYSGTVGEKYRETKWYTKMIYDLMCHKNVFNSEEGFLIVYVLFRRVIGHEKMVDAYYSYLINNLD